MQNEYDQDLDELRDRVDRFLTASPYELQQGDFARILRQARLFVSAWSIPCHETWTTNDETVMAWASGSTVPSMYVQVSVIRDIEKRLAPLKLTCE